MKAQGFSDRLRIALRHAEARHDVDIEQGALGAAVGRRLGRQPYSQGAVSRWLVESEPGLDVIAALAAELGVSPGWLAFGEGGMERPSAGELSGAADAIPPRRRPRE